MNIVIVGLGSIGKYYLNIIPKIVKKYNIFVVDKKKLKKSKQFIQISFNEIIKKKNSCRLCNNMYTFRLAF